MLFLKARLSDYRKKSHLPFENGTMLFWGFKIYSSLALKIVILEMFGPLVYRISQAILKGDRTNHKRIDFEISLKSLFECRTFSRFFYIW